MNELLERLRRGYGPPLRKSDLQRVLGIGRPMVAKLIREGNLQTVRMPGMTEARIPVRAAAQLARALGALPDDPVPAR